MTNPGNNPFPNSTGEFPGQVLSKWRWKPPFAGIANMSNNQFLDQFTPTILLESDDMELHFKGCVGWGGDSGFVNLGLIRNASLEVMTFQSYTASTGFTSIDLLYTDRPGAGSHSYTLQGGENLAGTVDFLNDDSWIEITKVYMPQSVYVVDSNASWTWS